MDETGRERPEDAQDEKSRTLLVDLALRLLREKPLGVVGGVIVLVLLFSGIFAEWIAPYGMTEQKIVRRLSAPSGQHLLGTDQLGRDLFSRIIFGARISMYVGLGGALLCTVVATVVGLSSFFGGKTDMAVQRFVDAWMCFPAVFIYLTVMSLIGQGLVEVIVVLGVARGIHQSRVMRGAVIGIRENVYIEAARAVGCSLLRTLVRHALPNVMAPAITVFAVSCGYLILSEATLSFLGFGIPPPVPSWGGMLSRGGREYMEIAPWMAICPGLALGLAVYGLNMLGDAVRDLLDPRLRGGLGRYGGVKGKLHDKQRKGVEEATH